MTKYILSTFASLIFSLSISAQCIEDSHSTFANQGWLSCQQSANPVPGKSSSHWVAYNLGEVYSLEQMYYWNHNVWGETGYGAKRIAIDYSLDGDNWSSAGEYTLEKAPGSWKYSSSEAPNLFGIECQYLVITVLETWDASASCAGIAEWQFELGTVTSSEDIAEEMNTLSLSPNPTQAYIDIKLSECEVLFAGIYNSIGQQVKSINPSRLSHAEYTREDVSMLESGVYMLNVLTSNGKESRSFVKME